MKTSAVLVPVGLVTLALAAGFFVVKATIGKGKTVPSPKPAPTPPPSGGSQLATTGSQNPIVTNASALFDPALFARALISSGVEAWGHEIDCAHRDCSEYKRRCESLTPARRWVNLWYPGTTVLSGSYVCPARN